MKKLLILLPCYNDWNNLNILIPKINKILKTLIFDYKIIIINDASTINLKLNFSKFKSIFKQIHFYKRSWNDCFKLH